MKFLSIYPQLPLVRKKMFVSPSGVYFTSPSLCTNRISSSHPPRGVWSKTSGRHASLLMRPLMGSEPPWLRSTGGQRSPTTGASLRTASPLRPVVPYALGFPAMRPWFSCSRTALVSEPKSPRRHDLPRSPRRREHLPCLKPRRYGVDSAGR
jgi:hypothetical protein